MTDRRAALIVVATIAAAAVAVVARADPPTEGVVLSPNAPGVSASATIAGGTLAIRVAGLPGGARVSAHVDRLACGAGYAARAAGGVAADGNGRASWRVDDALVPAVRDGRYVLALTAHGRTVACGSVPTTSHATAPRPRHWGIWAFTRRFVD